MDATFTPADLDAVVRPFGQWPGGLLPALHALQHEFGYIDHEAIAVLAELFNLSVAEVHGVVSFYKDFRTVAPKGPIVQVCRAEACQARGWMVENDNVADALGIMNFGCCIIDPNYAVRQGPLFRRAEMKIDNEKREAK